MRTNNKIKVTGTRNGISATEVTLTEGVYQIRDANGRMIPNQAIVTVGMTANTGKLVSLWMSENLVEPFLPDIWEKMGASFIKIKAEFSCSVTQR